MVRLPNIKEVLDTLHNVFTMIYNSVHEALKPKKFDFLFHPINTNVDRELWKFFNAEVIEEELADIFEETAMAIYKFYELCKYL